MSNSTLLLSKWSIPRSHQRREGISVVLSDYRAVPYFKKAIKLRLADNHRSIDDVKSGNVKDYVFFGGVFIVLCYKLLRAGKGNRRRWIDDYVGSFRFQ